MSHVLQGGGDVQTSIYNNNYTENRIEGSGNTINTSNRNVNLVFPQGAHASPSEIVQNALGKHHVPDAAFESQTESGCMRGTRVQFLSDVLVVLKARTGPRIAWVAGMAGTGKTSIALTLCQELQTDSSVWLGGAFFCSRSAGSIERTDVRRIIPTLAISLARQLPSYASALASILKEEPEIAHRPVPMQVEFLLKKPLSMLALLDRQIIFVIDALDECSDKGKLSELLNALADFKEDTQVKFLLTSRPEMHIRETPINDAGLSTILQLHTIDTAQVMEDIRLYIGTTLGRLEGPGSWYTGGDIDALVRLSAGLFIFAATVLRYIQDRSTSKGRQERLRKATSASKTSPAATAPVDRIYKFILTEASRSDNVDDDELIATRRVLAGILTVRASVSVDVLAELLGVEAVDLRECLDRLHSVVYLPPDNATTGVRTLHASLGDYLFERASSDLRIDPSFGHEILARGCLTVMTRRLHFNVSQSRSSYELTPSTLSGEIILSLVYACLQWIHHIADLPQPSILDEAISTVFRPRFLFWLEVLSVLGHVHRAAAMLIFAAAAVEHPELSRFLRDANVFVISSQEAIKRSVPHIYLSALPFAAQDSLVYRDFAQFCVGVLSVQTAHINRHGGRLVMILSGHEDSARAVAHSSDGHLLVSGGRDGMVRIWDVRTGEQAISPLQRAGDCVHSVAFSSDGNRVASATETGTVQVWDVVTGSECFLPLTGHSAAALAVAFSPANGSPGIGLIASGSADRTVRLWNAATGAPSIVLTGHNGCIRAVTFSPDGKIIASGSDDGTARLWHVDSGEVAVPSLCGDLLGISSVCFSPSGSNFASSSYDGVIRLWAWRASESIAVLRGHSDSVNCIRFSSDGLSILSASTDTTVRLWDLRSGHTQATSVVLGRHSGPVNAVSCSPNGLYIASASDDRTIRMWHTGDSHPTLQSRKVHTAEVNSVAVSPDGKFIVSASSDRSIRVWDIMTGLPKLEPLLGHEGEVRSIAISADGSIIASGSADRTVRLWDARDGKAIGAPRQCESEIDQISFSQDKQWIVSGSTNGTVSVWAVPTWLPALFSPLRCIGAISQQHQTLIPCAVSFSNNSRYLAAATLGVCLPLWDASTGQSAYSPFQASLGVALGPRTESDLHFVISKLPGWYLRDLVDQIPAWCLRDIVDRQSLSDLRVAVSLLPLSNLRTAARRLSPLNLAAFLCRLKRVRFRDLDSHSTGGVPPSPEILLHAISQMPSSKLRTILSQLPEADLRDSVSYLNFYDLCSVAVQLLESDLRAAIGRQSLTSLHTTIGQMPQWHVRAAAEDISGPELYAAVSRLPLSDLRGILVRLSKSRLSALVVQLPESRLRAMVSRVSLKQLLVNVERVPWAELLIIVCQLPTSDLPAEFDPLDRSEVYAVVSQLLESDLRAALDRLSLEGLKFAIGQFSESDLHDIVDQMSESDLRAFFGQKSESVPHETVCQDPESNISTTAAQSSEPQPCTDVGILPVFDLRTAVGRLPQLDFRTIFVQLAEPEVPELISRMSERWLRSSIEQLLYRLGHGTTVSLIPELELRMAIDRFSDSMLCAVFFSYCRQNFFKVASELPESYLSAAIAELPDSDLEACVKRLGLPLIRALASRLSDSDLYFLNRQGSELDLRSLVLQWPELELRSALCRMPKLDLQSPGGTNRAYEVHEILSLLREGIGSIAFSPDSMRIVTGVENGTVYVWDVSCRSQILALPGHSSSVSAVSYSPEGGIIGSGSDDTTVRLWDAEKGNVLAVLRGHTQWVTSIAFTPDGLFIVSGADDGTIRVWDVNAATAPASQNEDDSLYELARSRYENGWLVGSQGELLLWVPQEYRANLIIGQHCRTLIASHQVYLTADSKGLYGGEDWTKCWNGSITVPNI